MNLDQLAAEIRRIADSFPRPEMALVPAIQYLLSREDSVEDEALQLLADICGRGLSSVGRLCEIYGSGLRRESRPALCVGLPCWTSGADSLRESLRDQPRFLERDVSSVEFVPCLGYCYAAPVYRSTDGEIHRIVDSQGDSDQPGVASSLSTSV